MPHLRGSTIFRVRSAGANFVLAVGAVIAAFLLAEAGARILYHPENLGTVIRFDPLLGWSLNPDARLHSVDTVRDLDYTIRINSLGMRDREISRQKPYGRRRILFAGDSFCFGAGVDAGWRLSDFVDRALRDAEALNTGVGGWGTDQELLHYERVGHLFEPDVVVLVFCMSNDIVNNMLDHLYLGTAPKPRFVLRGDSLVLSEEELSQPRVAHRHRIRDWLRQSRLLLFAKRRIDAMRTVEIEAKVVNHPGFPLRDATHVYSHWTVFERDYNEDMEQGWHLTERILERFARDCRRDGAELVVLAFPVRLEVDDAWRDWMMAHAHVDAHQLDIEKPFKRLEVICRRLGVPYLHPLSEFREAAKTRSLYFEKDTHPNAYGHAVAARAVLEELREHHGVAYTIPAADKTYLGSPATN